MSLRTVRFYGTESSVKLWRALVLAVVGREGTPVVARPTRYANLTDYTFDVLLSDKDIRVLMDECWYAESGTGVNACGDPYRWNDCVGFEEVKASRKKGGA
jgi:hypothetical protein